jgi:predicted RNA-binding protein (virulence factor B family)
VIRQREDLKVDLSLHPIGLKALEEGAMSLLKILEAEPKGFLPIHDKSSPDQIYTLTHMSKKLFKKAVGGLLKSKKISIEATGIRLLR